MSRMETAMLLATLTALLLWAGQARGGERGLLTALLVAGLMNFGAYWFVADETGARLCGNPLALASSLLKLDAWSRQVPLTSGTPATAHLVIVNPLTGGGFLRMFSAHPSTEARVERLRAMARTDLTART